MKYTADIHPRKSIRLKEYDYSQNGGYFVTICVQNRKNLFGEIKNQSMFLNDVGTMIEMWWKKLPIKYSQISLDAYVIMPNHFHGIIIINTVGASHVGAHDKVIDDSRMQRAGTRPAPTIGDIVGGFKSITTHAYILGVKEKHWEPFEKRLWQRNYYEHVIRDEQDANRVREYIQNNPLNWEKDELYNL